MHGIARVPEHERWRFERAPLAARRGDAAEEQALEQRSARPRFLAHEVEHDVAEVGQQPARHRAGCTGELPHQWLPECERDEHGGEHQRAPQQTVVEHGHLDHHPPQPLAGARASSSATLAPSEVPITTACSISR